MPTTPGRVRELRQALETKTNAIEQMAANWKDETGRGQYVLSTQQHKDYLSAVNEATQIRELLSAEEKMAGIASYLDAPEGTPNAGALAAQAHRQGVAEVKSLGQMFLESDAWQEMKSAAFHRASLSSKTFDMGLEKFVVASRALEGKDVYSAMGGTIEIPTIGTAQSLGWTDRTLRPGRVRDLFPSERTTANILYGIREVGFTNRARVVPERTASDGTAATGADTDVFGLKPRSDIQIQPYTASIATIAHVMYVHRQTLDDEPRIRGLLDRDMVDGVKMAEDEQLLYGDGIGDNILGLCRQPGIQAYTGLNTDKRTAQVRRAMTRAILAYFNPTGVVAHPLDWEDMELEVDANGQYTVATSVAVGGEKRLWRLQVVDSPAMVEGKFLIGAFGTGAKVYDREAVRVDLSTENRDLFERNAYTLRAEERLGLVVDRPESFVYGTLTTPA